MANNKINKFTSERIERIINYYNNNHSLYETWKEFFIAHTTVKKILIDKWIKVRNLSEWNSIKWLNKDFRENQINKRKWKSTVLWKRRTLNIIRKNINSSWEKNWNWKWGKTKLVIIIRNCVEYNFWRQKVFERDNYTCVECNRKRIKWDRVIIQAHHKYPFSKILDDYEIKTMEEALSCKQLWDINNGITLCKECHSLTDAIWINQYTKIELQ